MFEGDVAPEWVYDWLNEEDALFWVWEAVVEHLVSPGVLLLFDVFLALEFESLDVVLEAES